MAGEHEAVGAVEQRLQVQDLPRWVLQRDSQRHRNAHVHLLLQVAVDVERRVDHFCFGRKVQC